MASQLRSTLVMSKVAPKYFRYWCNFSLSYSFDCEKIGLKNTPPIFLEQCILSLCSNYHLRINRAIRASREAPFIPGVDPVSANAFTLDVDHTSLVSFAQGRPFAPALLCFDHESLSDGWIIVRARIVASPSTRGRGAIAAGLN